MPSYSMVVNFVVGVPTTITVIGQTLEKNVSVGVYIDGVLMESAKTDVSKGNYDQIFTIPNESQADLLNHSMMVMTDFPSSVKSGSIGFCIVDGVKLELRYV